MRLSLIPTLAGMAVAALLAAHPQAAFAAPALHSGSDPVFGADPHAPAFPEQQSRPSFSGEVKLETEHFVVHYTTRGSDAPNTTDADDNGHPDYADKVAAAYEESWDVQQTEQSWAPPPPDQRRGGNDKYDVYIVSFASRGSPGVLGQAVPEGVCRDNPATEARERNACPGYTMVANTLGSDLQIRQVSGHEWQHQVQFGYVADPDWSTQEFLKVIWLYEASSKWMDQFQFTESRTPRAHLQCFMNNADLNMNAGDSPNCGALYRYAPFIFIQFLSERFGASVVREIWERAASERIFDDAVWQTLESKDDPFPDVWRDFSEALLTLSSCDGTTPRCFQRGLEYAPLARVPMESTIVLGPSAKTHTSRLHGNGRLEGQSADYIEVQPASAVEARLTFGMDPGQFSFLGVYFAANRAVQVEEGIVDGRDLVMHLRQPQGNERLVLVLANGSQRNITDYDLALAPIETLPTATPTATSPATVEVPTSTPTSGSTEPTPAQATSTPSATATRGVEETPGSGTFHILLPWSGNKAPIR